MEGIRVLRGYRGSTKWVRYAVIFALAITLSASWQALSTPRAYAGDGECIAVPKPGGKWATVCRESSGGGGDDGSPTRTPHDYWNTPSCSGNTPPPESSAGNLCNRATKTCELRGEEGTLMDYYIQWEADGPWDLSGTWCSGTIDDEFEPDIEPEQVAEEMAEHLLPDSDVRMSPENGRVLTNFPTIFYAEEDEFSDSATLLGVAIDIRARATEFRWTWGDGSSDTLDRPGIRFDGDTSNPEYVKHAYDAKDSYTAELVAVWEGEFRIAGEEWQDLPQMTVDRGEAGELTVLDKRNRLSNGN